MARYSGNKSWYNLLTKVYDKNIVGNIINASNYNSELISIPISFLRSNVYDKSNGNIDGRSLRGYYLESTFYSKTDSFVTYFNITYFNTQTNGGGKGGGYSVRCVAKLKNSSAFYGSLL